MDMVGFNIVWGHYPPAFLDFHFLICCLDAPSFFFFLSLLFDSVLYMLDTWDCAFSTLSIPCSYMRWEKIPIETVTVFVGRLFC